jgi:signal transduction histidine kinase/ActR/RegA family two-component response regulator
MHQMHPTPMPDSLLDPNDSLERQNEKLKKISSALMRRVEQDSERVGVAYAQFERAALLEDQVRQRTHDLEHALDLLNESNAALAAARRAAETAHANMANAIEAVEEGFALFDPDDTLVMRNSRFGMHMPDIQPSIVPGLAFSGYIDLVSQSRQLDLEGTTSEVWAANRQRLHREPHVMFNVRLVSDRWIQVSEHRTPDGGTVVLQTDVTDIMRMQRLERGKLLDNQARMLRATLDHLNQGVCIFDADGALVGWNTRFRDMLAIPAALLRLGVGFDRLVDHIAPDLDAPRKRIDAFRAWAQQWATRPALRFEVVRRPRTTLDIFAQEMPDRGFVVSFTDVTTERESARALTEANEYLERRVKERTLELEDALAAAERANASKSRFVAAASHDLLQPLSAAKLFMSSLTDAGGEGAATAQKAINALGSAEAIIDALLNISKLDSGAVQLDITSVSLGPILDGLRDAFEPAARLKGIDLTIRASDAIVRSDPSFLRRILQNLIGNAVRYTETGRVLVGVRPRGNRLRVEVWDTGPGIAEDDQERIFREFERLSPKSRTDEGLGLGLAIVERACAQLGHPLGVDSILGRGTRFFVSLDRVGTAPAPRDATAASGADRSLADAGLVVLLVENDVAHRRALAQLVEGWGLLVLEAGCSEEAVQLLDEIQLIPDVALIDHHLGDGESGLDLVRRLQRMSRNILPCLMTADRSSALTDRCAQERLPLLLKPIDTDALRDVLHQATTEPAFLRMTRPLRDGF